MTRPAAAAEPREFDLPAPWSAVCAYVGGERSSCIVLDGAGAAGDGWATGPLVALDVRPLRPAVEGRRSEDPASRLRAIDRAISLRRRRGGTSRTGVVVLLAYEALDGWGPDRSGVGIAAFAVDRSLALLREGRGILSQVAAAPTGGADPGGEAWLRGIERRAQRPATSPPPARVSGPVRCSLGREAYLDAVREIRRRIYEGDVYQANLCQRFEAPFRGDEWACYAELARATPAPRSAFVRGPGFCVASVSPEIFLRGRFGGRVETWPIKGTRARHEDPLRDRLAADELRASTKDRAELLMIVDLERNDLGRVCRTGSIEVPELAGLHSYAAVHHLVARVAGLLRPEVGPHDLLRATFPGGSISGAPKLRAREILRTLEPVPRGFFTGSLCWFGDDGGFDSSILIRTVTFRDGLARLGAGGGIVADSDPEQEWQECLVKARAPAAVLGFDPAEAA